MPENKPKTPIAIYLIGILCLVPFLGAVVGLVLIILGIAAYRNWIVITIGAVGILWTVAIYSSLFIFFSSHWMSNQLAPGAKKELTNVARALEFYKIETGDYPDSLTQLLKKDHWIFIGDPTQMNQLKRNMYFQYKHLGDHYTLYSLGPDGIAHTSDDIYPDIPDTGHIHYGWVSPN